MSFYQIVILAIVQGAAELLPVSSSAHVIVAEKLLGLDPTSPEMTLLLVMLHTGTMFAVITYFWRAWKKHYFYSRPIFWKFAGLVTVATACTGVVGLALKYVIEKIVFRQFPHAEVELLFGNLPLIAAALAAVGLFIIYAGLRQDRGRRATPLGVKESGLDRRGAGRLSALPGIFPLRRHHLHGAGPGGGQRPPGRIQLCPGRGPDPPGDLAGGSALVAGPRPVPA